MPGQPLFVGTVETSTLLRFATAALLIELTPGPNMGFLAIVAAQRGRRAGLLVVVGIALGLSCFLALAVIGVAEGLLADRWVYETLRWFGIGYMLWLAWDAWRADPAPPMMSAHQDVGLLARGLLTNLLNVKAAIFYAVLLPAFLDVGRGSLWAQASVLGATHLAIATVVHASIVMLAAKARHSTGGRLARLGRFYAIGLVAVAIWLAWNTRR